MTNWAIWDCRGVWHTPPPPSMFDITKIEDISVLHLCGEITQLELELIGRLIESLKIYQHNKIVIDLARVDYVHFKAFSKWARQAAILRESEGDLRISAPNNETRNMLKFTGADQFLEDYASANEAVLSFLKTPALSLEEATEAQANEKNQRTVDRWNPARRTVPMH